MRSNICEYYNSGKCACLQLACLRGSEECYESMMNTFRHQVMETSSTASMVYFSASTSGFARPRKWNRIKQRGREVGASWWCERELWVRRPATLSSAALRLGLRRARARSRDGTLGKARHLRGWLCPYGRQIPIQARWRSRVRGRFIQDLFATTNVLAQLRTYKAFDLGTS